MECGLDGRIASRENLLSGARRFLLAPSDAEAVLDSVFMKVRASWRDTMRESGVSVADTKRMSSAFVHPWLPVAGLPTAP